MGFLRRPNLIKDHEDPDPQRRYKMIFHDQVAGKWGDGIAYSPDGIQWKLAGDVLNIGHNGVLSGWDPALRRFVLYTRGSNYLERDFTHGDVNGFPPGGQQHSVNRLLLSPDFQSFSDEEEVIRWEFSPEDDLDDLKVGELTAISYTDDLRIGTLGVGEALAAEEYQGDTGPLSWLTHGVGDAWTELMSSCDHGRHWGRVWPRHQWFRNGQRGLGNAWDCEWVEPAQPIVKDNEIWIFYRGSNLDGNAYHDGHPQFPLFGEMDQLIGGQRHGSQIGVAKMRLDGFASLQAFEPGVP